MRSILAVVWGLHVAADKCDDDITTASQDLAQCVLFVVNMHSGCKPGVASCVATLETFFTLLGTASESINKALTDCGDQGSLCNNDISNLMLALGDLSETIVKAVDDCTPISGRCVVDVVKVAKDISNAVQYIVDANSDCTIPSIGPDCKNDIKEALGVLAKAGITAISRANSRFVDCPNTNTDKCIKEFIEIVEKMGRSSVIITKAATDCSVAFSECASEIGKLADNLGRESNALAKAFQEDCFEKETCDDAIAEAVADVFAAIGYIVRFVPVCSRQMGHNVQHKAIF